MLLRAVGISPSHLRLQLLVDFVSICATKLLWCILHPLAQNTVIFLGELVPGGPRGLGSRSNTPDGAILGPGYMVFQIFKSSIAYRMFYESVRVPTQSKMSLQVGKTQGGVKHTRAGKHFLPCMVYDPDIGLLVERKNIAAIGLRVLQLYMSMTGSTRLTLISAIKRDL